MNIEHQINSQYETIIETTAVSWMVEQLADPAKLPAAYGFQDEYNSSGMRLSPLRTMDASTSKFVRRVPFSGLADHSSANEFGS
ncbi:hypothetical protein [Paraburkholderia flava]|uniref:hypothetical protein n=1 Tax=Paraburkholderia flava TaxID=2547393 RepID=UPI00105CE393|nr:hypothetical protein [Paraburkholderia flava]